MRASQPDRVAALKIVRAMVGLGQCGFPQSAGVRVNIDRFSARSGDNRVMSSELPHVV